MRTTKINNKRTKMSKGSQHGGTEDGSIPNGHVEFIAGVVVVVVVVVLVSI